MRVKIDILCVRSFLNDPQRPQIIFLIYIKCRAGEEKNTK